MAISVNEVIATAAELVSRADVAAKVQENAESDQEVALLVRCFNLVESEIALDYFPLTASEEVVPTGTTVEFAALKNEPVQIVSVKDPSDMGMPFSVTGQSIVLKRSAPRVTVKYMYAPSQKGLGEESELGTVSARLMALGVASEYLLACGRYEEAAAFEARYHDAVRAANIVRRKLTIPARRWA